MMMGSGRWLGVRLDVLAAVLIGVVAFAAILVSQDAGRYNEVCSNSSFFFNFIVAIVGCFIS